MRWLLVVLALAATACSSDGRIDGPVLIGPSADHGMDAIIGGTLLYDADRGCLLLQREGVVYPVVWPPGTTWRPDPPAVVLPDGAIVEPGMSVTGGGGHLPRYNLEIRAGSRVANAAEACRSANGEDAAVFDSDAEITVAE